MRTPAVRKDTVIKLLSQFFSGIHSTLYRLTGGRVGGNFRGGQVLLLTTIGRKSGKVCTRPLMYFRDGENLLLVGSNGGTDRDPGWCLNLRHSPQALVELGRRKLRVRAEEVHGEQRNRLWQIVTTLAPFYAKYQTMTRREIPLVLLHPEP